MNNFQNKRCYGCGMFGHISNQCGMRPNQMSFKPMQNVACHACNKIGHIAKYCRRKKSALVEKNKSDEKGKEKVEKLKDKHEKMWARKDESKEDNGLNLGQGLHPVTRAFCLRGTFHADSKNPLFGDLQLILKGCRRLKSYMQMLSYRFSDDLMLR